MNLWAVGSWHVLMGNIFLSGLEVETGNELRRNPAWPVHHSKSSPFFLHPCQSRIPTGDHSPNTLDRSATLADKMSACAPLGGDENRPN